MMAAMDTITLDIKHVELTDEQFFNLCQANRDLRFERSATGELLIMAQTGWKTGNWSGRITQQLFNWVDSNNLGIAFDSSTNELDTNHLNSNRRCEKWHNLSSITPIQIS
jgi:Uma2 family endonuclease